MIPLKLLNQTIDSLNLRLYSCSAPSPFLESLTPEMRLFKEDYRYDSPSQYFVDLPNLGRFEVLHKGNTPYEFVLMNKEIADIRVFNPDKFISKAAIDTGHLYINFHSKYLQCQSDDYHQVDDFVENCFQLFYQNKTADWCKVSRADLACDVQGFDFNWQDLKKFAKRSRKLEPMTLQEYIDDINAIFDLITPQMYDKGGCNDTSLKSHTDEETGNLTITLNPSQIASLSRLLKSEANNPELTRLIMTEEIQTCYFGRFGSKLYARLYNKSREIVISGKEFLRDIWLSNGWDGESKVVRSEFSLAGEFLREFHTFTLDDGSDCFVLEPTCTQGTSSFHWKDFKKAIPQIWTYLTCDWLRHTTAENTLNSRSPNSEYWDCVGSAFGTGSHFKRESVAPPASEKKVSQLLAQATGCVRTAAALLIGGWSKAYHWLEGEQEDYLPELLNAIYENDISSITFTDVLAKRNKYGLDEFSDTMFSAALRRDKLKMGRGS